MKGSLIQLLKIQFFEQTNINGLIREKDARARAKSILVCVAWIIVALAVVAYSFGLAYGYGQLGLYNILPAYALALTAILNLTFTFIKTNGVLFAVKDYDLLMALPIKAETIISSKFLYMYLGNLFISLGVMLPMGIGYGIFAQTSVVGYIFWIVLSLVSPLLPMTLASIAGAIIVAIGSRFRRFKVLAQVILTVLFVGAIFGVSALLQNVEEAGNVELTLEEAGVFLKGILNKIYPMTLLFEEAIINESIINLIFFLLISIVVYYIFVSIVASKYQRINTALMTGAKRSEYKMNKLEANSVVGAIVYKELKRFTSSMVYITNMGVGILMAFILTIAMAFVGTETMASEMDVIGGSDMMINVMPFMLGMVLSMTCTPVVSLSLEGKSFWIIKSLPIAMKDVYKGKIIFNLLLLIPTAFICNIILIIGMKPNMVTALLYFVVTTAVAFLSSTFGMLIGKQFVNFNWKNEIEVIKQGAASLFGILGNMLIGMGFLLAAGALSTILPSQLAMLLISIIMLLIAWGLYKLVIRPTSTLR